MRTAIGLAIWLGLASVSVSGQEKAPLPRKGDAKPVPKKLVLTVGSWHRLQMSERQVIKTVINDNDSVIQVAHTDDPRTLVIRAIAPGRARLTLIGEDGNKETLNFGKPSDKVALVER